MPAFLSFIPTAIRVKSLFDNFSKSDKTSEIGEVFLKAFLKALEKISQKIPNEKRPELRQLKDGIQLRASDIIKALDFENDSFETFEALQKDPNFLEKIVENLKRVIPAIGDNAFLREAVFEALSIFPKILLRELSAEQTSYLVLQKLINIEALLTVIPEITNSERGEKTDKQTDELIEEIKSSDKRVIDFIKKSNHEKSNEILSRDSKIEYLTNKVSGHYKQKLTQAQKAAKVFQFDDAKKVLFDIEKEVIDSGIQEPQLLGRIYFELGYIFHLEENDDNAHHYFFKAFEYIDNEADVLFNVGSIFVSAGKREDAIQIIEKLKSQNPDSCKALALELMLKRKTPEEILAGPTYNNCKDDHLVNLVLAKNAELDGNIKDEIHHLRVALKSKGDDLHAQKKLAFLLSRDLVSNFFDFKKSLSSIEKRRLKEARNLYYSVWEKVQNSDLAVPYSKVLINISAIHFRLKKFKKALNSVKEAINQKPGDSYYLYHKALYFKLLDKPKKALVEIDKIENIFENLDYLKLKAEFLFNSGKKEESILFIESNLEKIENINDLCDTCYFLIQIYLNIGDTIRAESSLDSYPRRNTVQFLLLKSQIESQKGNETLSKEIDSDAYEKIDYGASKIELAQIADHFYFNNSFRYAANVYEKIVAEDYGSSFIHLLTNCYLRLSDWVKLKDYCKRYRESFGFHLELIKKECHAYYQLNEYQKLIDVGSILKAKEPDFLAAHLNIAQAFHFLKKYEEARKVISELGTSNVIKDINATEQAGLILCKQQDFQLALQILYEYRRTNQYTPGEKSDLYSKFGMIYGDNLFKGQQEIDFCSENTAVTIRSLKSGNTKTFVFERRDNCDVRLHEYDLSSLEYERLMNKKVGDQVLWEGDILGDEVLVEIVSIQSKFIYWFQKSISYSEQSLGTEKLFHVVSFESTEELHEKITRFLQGRKGANELEEMFWDYYKNWELPIHAINILSSSKFFNAIQSASDHSGPGIHSSLSLKDSSDNFNLVKQKIEEYGICLDVTTIFALQSIGIGKEILKEGQKFIIPESVIRQFEIEIQHIEMANRDNLALDMNDKGEVIPYDITKGQKQTQLEDLNDKVDWIRNNCIYKPPIEEVVFLENDLRRTLGVHFIESLDLCKENGFLLICDDQRARDIAKQEFDTFSISSIELVLFLYKDKKIQDFQKDEFLIGLQNQNHRYLPVDSETMRLICFRDVKRLPSLVEDFLHHSSQKGVKNLVNEIFNFLNLIQTDKYLNRKVDYLLEMMLSSLTINESNWWILFRQFSNLGSEVIISLDHHEVLKKKILFWLSRKAIELHII